MESAWVFTKKEKVELFFFLQSKAITLQSSYVVKFVKKCCGFFYFLKQRFWMYGYEICIQHTGRCVGCLFMSSCVNLSSYKCRLQISWLGCNYVKYFLQVTWLLWCDVNSEHFRRHGIFQSRVHIRKFWVWFEFGLGVGNQY